MLDEFLDIEDCAKELGYPEDQEDIDPLYLSRDNEKPMVDLMSSTYYDTITEVIIFLSFFLMSCIISFGLSLGLILSSDLIEFWISK